MGCARVLQGNVAEQETWQIAGASVRGASHIGRAMPNQDAAQWLLGRGDCSFAMAVADGHGAAVHSRSDRGAQLAVAIAVDELNGLMNQAAAAAAATDIPLLQAKLLGRWQQAVQADLAKYPLVADESFALAAARLDPVGAYGTTLLAVFVRNETGFAIQIGDGTIYLVGTDGTVGAALTPPVFPNEATYSLCMPDALDVIEARIFDAAALGRIVAIVLSTDGYSKSFRTDEMAAAQIKTMIDRLNWDNVETASRELEDRLNQVSGTGSGDDISLIAAARRIHPG